VPKLIKIDRGLTVISKIIWCSFLPHVVVVVAAAGAAEAFVCSKVRDYSPSEASKVYNQPVKRRLGIKFNPIQVIDLVRLGSAPLCETQLEREKIVTAYLEVLIAFILEILIHCLAS